MKPAPGIQVKVTPNGPYEVTGIVPVRMETIGVTIHKESVKWIRGKTFPTTEQPFYLCRCGHSKQKPFCDDTHLKIRFDGTETAAHTEYVEEAELLEGPAMLLTDVQKLCAFARFCDPNGQVWNTVNDTDDPNARAQFTQQVNDCPSGRLVAWNKQSQTPVEPDMEPAIGVVEDPVKHISGPLWLQGGIEVTDAEGVPYEVRNRVTLCRCGASSNKPFCDGTHASIEFKDGIEP
ncbi:CDGSH iron-sulfur domain-containing protein [Chitinophaga arvensicola]|uniref:Zn-finger domain of CDGSH type-containing protein n=1 Tax=Chitinophaga arvensicola TaxID=29529 RepID=A0A1I0S7B4_9BACT|nr:CDGSH iron-sulfur domain-containing protein [Chitinophaga arvensicola]SEW51640.1 Zn-finger domain of CDGSH type-containing protein [Chitinophaga arvensicola]